VTLADMEKLANAIARWGLARGLEQKTTVALMLLNRPEYVTFWVGMAKIGSRTIHTDLELFESTSVIR